MLRKVVLPLGLPGVFAGVIPTFVPAMADYVNSSILGGTGQTNMVGNTIQTLYITNADYPHAAALSWLLLEAMLLSIFTYARILGTEADGIICDSMGSLHLGPVPPRPPEEGETMTPPVRPSQHSAARRDPFREFEEVYGAYQVGLELLGDRRRDVHGSRAGRGRFGTEPVQH